MLLYQVRRCFGSGSLHSSNLGVEAQHRARGKTRPSRGPSRATSRDLTKILDREELMLPRRPRILSLLRFN